MVDVLGGFVATVAMIFVVFILIGFRIRQDFMGIGAGIAVATALTYLTRNHLWGVVQSNLG